MKRIVLAVLAAVATMASAAPASAQSQAMLDCVPGAFSSGWRDDYAFAATHRETTETQSQALRIAVNSCAERHGLPRSSWPAYFEYSMTRIERDAFAARLAAANIPTAVIDEAVGFGPGRANPVLTGSIGDAQIDAIYGALRRAGVDVNSVAGETWSVIGVYTQASSTMWNALSRLR